MPSSSKPWIQPEWPAPSHIKALTTLRYGVGNSLGDYASFNLAQHVGDAFDAVQYNRQWLKKTAALPNDPQWLSQVHGIDVVDISATSLSSPISKPNNSKYSPPEADAAITTTPGRVCAVLTADCLPILITNMTGTCVAAIHAGWRGLALGVIEATIARLPAPASSLMAWLGPAIGPQAFEVGQDVKELYTEPGDEAAFQHKDASHWILDIYAAARNRLSRLTLKQIYGGGFCTYQDPARFYSYRRSKQTGRMASLIWIE